MQSLQSPPVFADKPADTFQRLGWLDLARGIAVLAMILYHFSWDLSFHGLIETDVSQAPEWRWFARGIAASFLYLGGISLYMAHGQALRPAPFLRRLCILVAAAALVSLGTWYQFPQSYVFFGILHCIALSSVLSLIFLRAPFWLTILAAIAAVAAPHLYTGGVFNEPLLAFIGLRNLPVRSNDFVPLLPWTGPMLAGLASAQLAAKLNLSAQSDLLDNRLLRALRFGGRHSLIIYLVHQPLLFGATALFIQLFGTTLNDDTGAYLSACETTCVTRGQPRDTCIEICFCTVDGLKATGVWNSVSKGAMDEKTRAEVSRMSNLCQR